MMQVMQIARDKERTVMNLLDGARMELLSPSNEDAYCVLRGTIPPGVSVPLHSHADAESFYVLSGEAEALVQTEGGFEWQMLRRGDFIHIFWRNKTQTRVAKCVQRANVSPDYLHCETWTGASGDGATSQRIRHAIPVTDRHSASRGNIHALSISLGGPEGKRSSRNTTALTLNVNAASDAGQ